MIKSLFNSLFAVFLFASGIAGSWYFTEYRSDLEGDDDERETPAPAEIIPRAPGMSVDPIDDELPVPFHGPAMSAADVFRYGEMNRKTMESLRRKEEQIRHEEMRLRLLNKDIEGRKREVEGILQQTQNALASLRLLRAELEVESQEFEERKSEVAPKDADHTETKVLNEERLANIKVTADWLAGMKTNDAAETLKNLANSGKMEFALRLLSNIEARKVAGILDAMQDPGLVADLTEGFLEVTRPPKNKKR